MKSNFMFGARDGLPIALGYLAVSFSFGMAASTAGIPIWVSVMLSALNLTSAGQFSALTLMCNSAPILEVAAATFIINIRYLLMSIVLSQKVQKMPFAAKMLVSFGITDEIFTVSSTKPKKVGFSYMMGLIIVPYIGWTLGTLFGAFMGELLPVSVSSALTVCLYAMFIAIFLPPAKEEKSVGFAVLIAVAISCIFTWVPLLKDVSSGWAVITASVIAALFAALLFPRNNTKRGEIL
ncbi:MAG: AzlC family ABC transporter permease [Clostridia bacterium]|nr:AzlC family ABC transporter permease [Clostridia bacterium]